MAAVEAGSFGRAVGDGWPLGVVLVVGVALAASVGVTPPSGVGLAGRLGLVGWLLGITAIATVDLREHRIPNRMVAGLAAATVLGLAVAVAGGGAGAERAGRVVLGAVAVGAVLLALNLASGGAVGMGDVKLSVPAALVVLWFGAGTAWVALAATVLPAACVVAGRAVLGRVQGPLPLAPFIAVGTGLALVAHP